MADIGCSSSDNKHLILITADKIEIQGDFDLAMESITIKKFYDGKFSDVDPLDTSTPRIPLPNVSAKTLRLVLEYQKLLRDLKSNSAPENEFKALNAMFRKEDKQTKISLVNAVTYLNFENLLEFILEAMADHIKNMSVEEVRELFMIENDFTAEEIEKHRREYYWTFEIDNEDVTG